MTLVARLRSWIRASIHRAELEQSMRDEMRLHMDLYEADLLKTGVSPEDARRRTHAEFGSVEARKDECREALGLRLLDELRADVSYALRLLGRSPGFAAVALLSLGLGIGANTAIFSLVDTVMVKSLPVDDPERLFFIDNSGGKSGGSSGPPYPCYETLRDRNRYLSGLAAFNENRFKVTIDGNPEQVRGQYASGSYFEVLGVRAAHGRVLTPADDSELGRGGPDGAVAVISHGFWQQRFGADPAVLGKNIQVGTHWVTIVGVTPPGFLGLQVGSPIDLTIPMMLAGRLPLAKQLWWMSVVGRLKPDATVEQARADLESMFDAYMVEIGTPRERRGYFSGIELVPAARGLNALRSRFSQPLLIVMAIVGIVLLIGCANVANLLLARASARQNEMSVRLAIGAGRGRLIRQLLTEGAVLASLGAIAGLFFARWGVSFLVGLFARGGHGILLNPQLDQRALVFTAGVATFCALLFSLAPALHATRGVAAKPAGGGVASLAKPRVRLGQALVVIQVMLSVALLCCAALFLRTLHNLNVVEAGFHREGVLTAQVEATLPARTASLKTPEEFRLEYARAGALWENFIGRLSTLPGITSAAVTTLSPLTGRDRGVLVSISGKTLPEQERGIHINQVTAGYFEAMGIPILAGRSFTRSDRSSSLPVAILNQTAARTYFGNESPIGKTLMFPGHGVKGQYQIVGVARDMRYVNLRTADERMAYLPIEQSLEALKNVMIAVRGRGDVTRLVPTIRKVATEVVPDGFVTRIATIDEEVRASLVGERLLSILATFFGGLALVLACLGLYGVMAYGVVRRTREIAIRIAIGARQKSVIWMVVRETLVLVALGVMLGGLSTLIAGRFIRSQLFGVSPGDPLAISAAILLLMAVAGVAGYLPARRATRIEPGIVLRYE